MTDKPPAMPELPETTYSLLYEEPGDLEGEGCQYVLDDPGYTGDQMRAYALATLQAQPAAVSDEEIDYAVFQAVGFDGLGTQEMNQFDCRNIARAILALRPQAAPMTDEQFTQLLRKLKRSREVFQAGRDSYETACAPMNSDDEAWFAYLAHYGITAQGAQGGEG